jgi:hypothetical protein
MGSNCKMENAVFYDLILVDDLKLPTLKNEAARSSETLANIYHTTRRHILGNCILHTHCRENLESHNSRLTVKVKMPWRGMRKWRYNSTILDLGAEWWLVVSFTLRPLYPGMHWIGGWVGPRVDLDAVEKIQIFPLLRTEPRLSNP